MISKPHYYVYPGISGQTYDLMQINRIAKKVAVIFQLSIEQVQKNQPNNGIKKQVTEARMIITLIAIQSNISQVRLKEYFSKKQQNSIRYYELQGKKLMTVYPDLKEKYALAMAN